MGSGDGGSGGVSNGGGVSGTGGNSGAGGGTGCKRASRAGYRDARKCSAYAGKKTVAGTHTRAIK